MFDVASISSIEAQIDFFEKRQISAGSTKYLFYASSQQRYMAKIIYCYEQVKTGLWKDRWILRGYLPISIWDWSNDNSGIRQDIDYVVKGDSVDLVYNGKVALTVNPLPASKALR
jgi:hypothetical protein